MGSAEAKRWPLAIILLLVPLTSTPGQSQKQEAETPPNSGLVEEEKVTLILLDVQGVDTKGRPLPGLDKDDFQLELNGRRWPIYSVDDLCSVPPDAAAVDSGERTGPKTPSSGNQDPSRPTSGGERPRFVLYLDFTHLKMDGRARALDAARRWVREEMRPGDEAMIMAHSLLAGLTQLSPFSQDREHLLAVIDEAETTPELFDQFAAELPSRLDECDVCVRRRRCFPVPECCVVCRASAMQDYFNGRDSLKMLKRFLTSLEEIPGRKVVLMFHQNTVLSPGLFYYQRNPDQIIGNQYDLLEEVGAEATAVHASVNPILVGENSEAVTLGANLADFTGGRYNRGLSDLAAVLADIGRDISCIYRIGFEPPDTSRSLVYRAEVTVGGRKAQSSYRVQFLTEEDRLMRRARSVLSAPHLATDLALTAGLLPSSPAKSTWDLSVEVALDLQSLDLLPITGDQVAELDIGALLHQEGTDRSWEMLTGTKLRKHGGSSARGTILYRRSFPALDPGRYRLVAFARNRQMDVFGGASATIELPGPRKTALSGPIAFTEDSRVFVSPLPLTGDEESRDERAVEPSQGLVPFAGGSVAHGQQIEIVTWLCPDKDQPPAEGLLRFLTRDDEPVSRLPPVNHEPAGRCSRIVDDIDTSALEPGAYSYHLTWVPPGGEPISAGVPFRVLE